MENKQLIKDVIRWIITTKNTEMLDESDVDLVYNDYVKEQTGNVAKPNACPQLLDVRALLQAIDDFHDSFTVQELESFSQKSLNAGVNLIRLKNKLSEHFV